MIRRPAATLDLKDYRAPGGPRKAIRRVPTAAACPLNQAVAAAQLPTHSHRVAHDRIPVAEPSLTGRSGKPSTKSSTNGPR